MQSLRIENYAITLIDATVNLFSAAANGKELKGVVNKYGQNHVASKADKAEFMAGIHYFLISFFCD